MAIQYPKNEFLISPTHLQTCAFLPISVNGDSLLPVAQLKTLETSPIPPLSPSCTNIPPFPPNTYTSDLLADQIAQAVLSVIPPKYILLTWNLSKNMQNSTTPHQLYYYNLGQVTHISCRTL